MLRTGPSGAVDTPPGEDQARASSPDPLNPIGTIGPYRGLGHLVLHHVDAVATGRTQLGIDSQMTAMAIGEDLPCDDLPPIEDDSLDDRYPSQYSFIGQHTELSSADPVTMSLRSNSTAFHCPSIQSLPFPDVIQQDQGQTPFEQKLEMTNLSVQKPK